MYVVEQAANDALTLIIANAGITGNAQFLGTTDNVVSGDRQVYSNCGFVRSRNSLQWGGWDLVIWLPVPSLDINKYYFPMVFRNAFDVFGRWDA